MLLKAYQERKSSEEEITATIDKANSEISTFKTKVSELESNNSRFLSENNALRDQVNVLSRERADDREKYQLRIPNLIQLFSIKTAYSLS